MRFRFTTLWVLLILAMTATYAMSAPIHDAAGKGDLAKVKALLKTSPKLVNLADKDGATPLHYAVAGNRKAVVEFLLAHKANVNAKKKNGVTPLHVAVAMDRLDITTVLLSKHANMDAGEECDLAPLHFVKSLDMARLLVANGVNVNRQHMGGRTVLHQLVNSKFDNSSIIKFLIEKGANPEIQDGNGETALDYAVKWGDYPSVVSVLLAKGARIDAKDNGGETPLDKLKQREDKGNDITRQITDLLQSAANGKIPAD